MCAGEGGAQTTNGHSHGFTSIHIERVPWSVAKQVLLPACCCAGIIVFLSLSSSHHYKRSNKWPSWRLSEQRLFLFSFRATKVVSVKATGRCNSVLPSTINQSHWEPKRVENSHSLIDDGLLGKLCFLRKQHKETVILWSINSCEKVNKCTWSLSQRPVMWCYMMMKMTTSIVIKHFLKLFFSTARNVENRKNIYFIF